MVTYLPKAHLVRKDTIVTLTPKIGEPVQASELKVLELAPCRLYVIRILGDLFKLRPALPRVGHALIGELGLRFTLSIRLDLGLRDRLHVLGEFPGTVLVVEPLPFAEILHFAVSAFSVRNNPFNITKVFELLPLTFFVKQKRFSVLAGNIRSSQAGLPYLVRLDVVVNPFESLEAFEEFVGLVSVVKMGKVFPFNMEALWYMLYQVKDSSRWEPTMFSNQRSWGSFSWPSSLLWLRTASISSSSWYWALGSTT